MRQIKFRGRDIETGEYVYAELGQVSAEINPEYLTFITDDVYTVMDVAQLIGIDAHGREVYEGDKVIRVAGEGFSKAKMFPMAATFEDYAAIRDEEIILVEAAT